MNSPKNGGFLPSAAQVEGMGIPCDKTYLSKILNGARKGQQVKAAIEKILDLEGGALGG